MSDEEGVMTKAVKGFDRQTMTLNEMECALKSEIRWFLLRM